MQNDQHKLFLPSVKSSNTSATTGYEAHGNTKSYFFMNQLFVIMTVSERKTLHTKYEVVRFHKIPINYHDTVMYIDSITRQTFEHTIIISLVKSNLKLLLLLLAISAKIMF